MKGHQFHGRGDVAVNLRNGAVSSAKPDTEVFRANAKVVIE